MEYVILGLILSGTMLYVMYARSDVMADILDGQADTDDIMKSGF